MITKELDLINSAQALLTQELSAREVIISEIIDLVDILKVEKLAGWDEIPFQNIHSLPYEKHHSTAELSVLLDLLNNRLTEMRYQSLMEKHYL